MKIGIYVNLHKDKHLAVTKPLLKSLLDGGFSVSVFGEAAKDLQLPDGFSKKEKPEVMLALGGDGTILRIVSYAAQNGIPILGLNLGTLGFLTGLEKSETEKLCAVLKSKNYRTERRFMLHVRFGEKEALALNEVVLERRHGGKMITVNAFVADEFVDRYFCDGFIVSTPTGSTAYSLSAGGPILSPRADAVALTPVCPHSLHARPVVVGGGEFIRLTLAGESEECMVTVDGNEIGVLQKSECIEIKKSDLPAVFLKTGNESFFTRLLHKLNVWSVTDAEE